jgi:hypothetical protein
MRTPPPAAPEASASPPGPAVQSVVALLPEFRGVADAGSLLVEIRCVWGVDPDADRCLKSFESDTPIGRRSPDELEWSRAAGSSGTQTSSPARSLLVGHIPRSALGRRTTFGKSTHGTAGSRLGTESVEGQVSANVVGVGFRPSRGVPRGANGLSYENVRLRKPPCLPLDRDRTVIAPRSEEGWTRHRAACSYSFRLRQFTSRDRRTR